MKELVCTPKRISLKKESPRAMPIHTSARHNALPARVGENSRRNISFGASCSFNQWHLWAWRDARREWHTCVRRYVGVTCSARKTTRIQRSRAERTSEKTWHASFFDYSYNYYLSTSKLRNAVARPFAIVSRDKLRRLHVSEICSFRIINHHNAISVNSTRYCWSLLHQV